MPAFTTRIPPDDSHPRSVCDTCGWVAYDNPKVDACLGRAAKAITQELLKP